MKVICVGSASKDIFFPTKEGQVSVDDAKKITFDLGGKYHISNRFESLGGCAANQSVGLRRLGQEVSCYSSLGSDDFGEWIRKALEKEGIGTGFLRKEEDCPSGLSAIVVDENSGDRVIFSNQEANERLVVETEKLEGVDMVSAADLSGDWKGILGEIFDFCQKNEIKISFNPRRTNITEDSDKVLELARKANVFFLNKEEAKELLMNVGKYQEGMSEKKMLEILAGYGAKTAIITDGENGAWAIFQGKIIQAKAVKQNAVDSTGAGDAFSSGFLAAYLQEKSLEECIAWGIVNGGNVVNYYGGVKGLLREDEIEEKARSVEVVEI
ncbi:MAG: carbohydrate kinase family protein [Patescibacteria group bacterium]